MYLDKLKAKNFGSFKELEYCFKTGKPILIVGENLTDDSQASNGSGKSFLQMAIEYCLYTTTSKKVTNSELINWNTESVEAELSLSIVCPIRKETLFIERKIHLKNGGQSQLSVNGVIKYSFEDKQVSSIDDFIIKWIGISKEDLQNYFIINKFRYTSFFDASNTKVVQLIGRFSNASIVEGIDKDIEKSLVDEATKIQLLDNEISRLSGGIDTYKSNIQKELNRDFEKEKAEIILSIEEKIDAELVTIVITSELIDCKTGEIDEITKEIEADKALLIETKERLDKVKVVSFDKEYQQLQEKVNKTKEEQSELEAKSSKLRDSRVETEEIINDIQRNIQGSVKCPKCSHEFLVGNPDVDIEEEKQQLPGVQSILDGIKKSLADIGENYSDLNIKLSGFNIEKSDISKKEEEFNDKIRLIQKDVNTIENHILSISNNISNLNDIISQLNDKIDLKKKNIESLKEQIEEVKNSKQDTSGVIKEAKKEIKILESKIAEINESKESIEDSIVNTKQWALNYKSFYQYLSNKTLKILESYTNSFLIQMRSDLRVQIEGYKLKADRSLTEKINVNILRDGTVRSFNSFSGGERARLEAAVILTIVQSISSTHAFGGLDLIFVDEIFESSDSVGISNLMDSFAELTKTILVTTQMPMSNINCDVLKIIKEFKISRIDE